MAAGPQSLTLYFHCAPVGTKLDLLRADPNVSFEADCPGTVSGGATSCTYGMNYQSVIGRGTVRFVEGGEKLTALQAHLAAWVDFPEEDVPELDPAHLRTVLGAVREELDALIRSYDAGAVLREGVDCAITMRELRPDVWKMSLRTGPRINATEACRLLGGGGHAAAAGCTVEAPWQEAKEQILAAVAQVAGDYAG